MPQSHAASASASHIMYNSSPEEARTHKGGLQVATEHHDPTIRRFSLCAIRPDFACLPSRIITSQQPLSDGTFVNGISQQAQSDGAPVRDFSWTVLWDIENVPVMNIYNGAQVVGAVGKALNALRPDGINAPAPVRRITSFTNVNNLRMVLRNELQAMGVQLMHVETEGRKDAADKALIVELAMTALDYPPPHGICLISGDQDYAYVLAVLKRRGYTTAVIGPARKACSPLLMNVPDYAMSMINDVLKDVKPRPSRRRKRAGGGPPGVGLRLKASTTAEGGGGGGGGGAASAAVNRIERTIVANVTSRSWPILYRVLVTLFPERSSDNRSRNISTSRNCAIVLITILSWVLARSALLALYQVLDSAAARYAWRSIIDSVHWTSTVGHLILLCILIASIRYLYSCRRFERKERRNKKRTNSLVNPPNL